MVAEAGLMAGKRGLVMGVANERSLAWAIARANSPSPIKATRSRSG
jgi:enoyl-[acyl-carrier-protein] reductase (NADH)